MLLELRVGRKLFALISSFMNEKIYRNLTIKIGQRYSFAMGVAKIVLLSSVVSLL